MQGSSQVLDPHPPWGAHVDRAFGDDHQALFEAGDAVEGVQLHPGWGHVEHLIRAEIRQLEQRLETSQIGQLPSRSDYAFAHGRLSGLKAASLAAEAILSRAQKRFVEQQRKYEADRERSAREA